MSWQGGGRRTKDRDDSEDHVGFTEMEVFKQDLEREGYTRWEHSLSRRGGKNKMLRERQKLRKPGVLCAERGGDDGQGRAVEAGLQESGVCPEDLKGSEQQGQMQVLWGLKLIQLGGGDALSEKRIQFHGTQKGSILLGMSKFH